MPRNFTELERQVLQAFRRALKERRPDVGDHLLRALEALDPDVDGGVLREAYLSIFRTSKEVPSRH